MIVQTERLILTKLETTDAPFILALLTSPGWLRYIGDRGVHDLETAKNYVVTGPQASYDQHGFGLYKVSLLSGEAIGMCGLLQRDFLDHPDIGFAFLGEHNGKGYAYEAARATIDWAKAKGIDTVQGITLAENERSIKLLEKLGLKYLKEIQYPNGESVSLYSN